MLIGGRDVRAPRQFAAHSPIDTRVVLGRFQAGEDVHANDSGRRGATRVSSVVGNAVAGARARCCAARSR